MNNEKKQTAMLAKIAEVVKQCFYFGNWDWCMDNCPLYLFCDGVYESQDVSKIEKGAS